MQAQSWFNRAHVEQSKQAPGQLERKIRQEKSHFYPIPFLKVYITIFIEKSDSKFGGLKKDLNIIFSQEKLPAEFRGDTADIGLRPYTSEDGNPSDQNRPIGSWNQLYLWANVWDSSTKREGQDASATLQWNGSAPSTLIAADAAANLEMMDNRYTYMRHPILLRYYNFIGSYLTKNDRQSQNGGWINTAVSVVPVYVWWNPYNVDMKFQGAGGNPWGSYFGEHRFKPMLFADNIASSGPLSSLKMYTEHPLTPYTQGAFGAIHDRQVADFGASYRKTSRLNDGTGEVVKGEVSVLKAGEIVVFSQPSTTRTNKIQNGAVYKSKSGGYDIRTDNFAFREGWPQDMSEMVSYGVNIYTGLQYQYFERAGYPTENKYTFWARFAETDNDLIGNGGNTSLGTPPNHVLCHKYTDEYNSNSKKLGTFMMGAGIMDASQIGKDTRLSGASTPDPVVFSKMSPSMLNLNWGFEEQIMQATKIPVDGWINFKRDEDEDGTKRGKYAEPEPDGPFPYFIAYYGVSVKWGKPPVIGAYPEGKDYRAKTWQHSSPLFWGGQMPTASELGRLYSPYQFEVKNANSDFFPITISNILSNDGTRLSPFGGPGAEQVNKIVAAELPFQQPSSLAGFAGCRLTPGWYRSDSRAAIAKRFAYQSGVPGVGIGNAFADPMLPADKVFSHNEIMGDAALGDFWDHGLMINDALWDSWFASSLAARPSSLGGTGREELKTVLQQAFSTDASSNRASGIANRRFMPDLQGKPSEAVVEELARTDEGYKHASKYLTVAGGFNVNSTSQRAWEATLLGLKKRRILYSRSGRPSVLNNSQTSFSRFGVASSDKSHVDDYGSIGVTQGIPDGEAMAWSDLRTLSDTQIRSLARNMVKEVKKRGPFLNMSDFVNRRLQSGEMGVKGALQAAIDESSINSTFDELSDMVIAPKGGYPNQDAARGSVYTAAPGYLIQSDVLAVLGNILTTRDDTFTVRAYGELANREGVVLSRAWCEAVVQRGINYVDPVNSPETPARQVNMKSGALEDTELSAVNKAFGRKFNIVSFRWLSPEEV